MPLLVPKKVKYRKQFRGRRSGVATRGARLSFGSAGLKSLENAWITSRQIEAARRTITRICRRGGQVYIRIFPDKSVVARSPESGMGGGKAAVSHYVAVVKRGTILFELGGVDQATATHALQSASYKLPFETTLVTKD